MLDEIKRLRRQPILPAWERHVSEDKLDAVRQILRSAIDELVAAGRNLEPEIAEDILGQAVEHLNDLDQEEPFIFTLEREDLCEWLTEVGHLAGLDADGEWIDEYRDW